MAAGGTAGSPSDAPTALPYPLLGKEERAGIPASQPQKPHYTRALPKTQARRPGPPGAQHQ